MSDTSEHQQATDSNTLQEIFRHIGALIAIIAPISIVVSFVYDWGFFSALGISFQQAPTTLYDHVRSWLVWLPKVLVVAVILLTIEFFLRRIERGMTEDEITTSAPNPRRSRKFRNAPYIFLVWLGPCLVILWLLFGKIFRDSLSLGLIISWFLFSAWIFRHPKLSRQYSKLFKLSFHWIIPIVYLVFSWGEWSADTQVFETRIPKEYRSYDRVILESSGIKKVSILRTFDKWILIRDEKHSLAWIPTGGIYRIELEKEDNSFQGLVCIFSDKLCAP